APKIKPEPWSLPDRYDVSERAEQRLAEGVAEQIAGLTRDDEAPVPAQDILVLIKKRSAFASTLINALKNRGIPVEGADRLSLTDELAVRDLLVLADFLLQREDDLALATVLRSPLIGLDEEQLFKLAYDRGEQSLWDCLTDAATEDARLGQVQAYLAALLVDVDFVTPHSLFSAILSSPCPADDVSGRRAMTARLGRPINDPVDELLSQSLAFEANHAPSLQGFQHWLRLSDEPLKRAAGEQPAGVRVMTIHGAKGLEANTVILADIDSRSQNDDALYWFEPTDGGPALPLWRPVKEITCSLLEDRHDRRQAEDEAEEMRLLYVALTRAEQRLFICGTGPADEKKDKPQRWYAYCQRAMDRLDPTRTRPFDGGDDDRWTGEAIRYALREQLFSSHGKIEQEPSAPRADHWSRRRAPAAEAQHIIRPSRWESDVSEPAVLSPTSQDGQDRFRRGLIIHTLLERLPALPPEDRQSIGQAYLNRPIHGLTEGQAEEYLAEALGVIDDPDFGPIFTPDAMVEAPIVGQVGSRVINGQIDRMVIGTHEILIVDFKTNRPPPKQVDQTAPVYLRQMASYQAVLQQIYPDRAVKCALLWTVEPRLMPLPNNILTKVLCDSGS
ncbi:MAG: 3'-5' exonuclease, partial [Pseudomonadota bacterium]